MVRHLSYLFVWTLSKIIIAQIMYIKVVRAIFLGQTSRIAKVLEFRILQSNCCREATEVIRDKL
jgi:hypothetical protein